MNIEVNESSKTVVSIGLVFLTVLLTVYCQIIVKWRVLQAGSLPADFTDRMVFLTSLFFDRWVITTIPAVLLAGLSWMAAMTRLQLSYAYPFMSLAFVLVLILSSLLFHEAVTMPKVLGMVLVIVGLIIASQG